MKKIVFLFLSVLVAISVNAQLDRSKMPAAGPAPKINIEDAKTFELKNGLKVIVVENHKVPVVSYSLSLDIDPIFEGDKAGYISMAGDLMRAGTTTKSKAEIDEAVDFIGAVLSTNSKSIYASSLKKHSDELLDLLADVLYNPVFPQEELDKSVKQMLTGIKADKEDPSSIANNISGALLYGKDHPYGEILTEQTVENITVDDIKNYYETYFRPNVAYLVIVGDISMKEAKKQAKTYFAKWEEKEVPEHKYEAPATFDGPKVVVANKDAANQSTIDLTYTVNLKPGDDDLIKARVMNGILGGGSSGRLFQNLREDKAFTYGAYSSLSSDDLIGSFSASAQVRTSVTDSAFTEIIYEMDKMRTELVSEEDLNLVKNMIAGSFSRSLEDASTVARFALNIQKYNLPKDYYQTYLEKLSAVSLEDVQAMAQKYLTPDNALILAVGNVPEMKKTLKKFSTAGDVAVYNYYAEEVKSMPLPEGLTAEKVIEDYVTALGGADAVNAVKNYSMQGSMTVQGMNLTMKMYSSRPNKSCVETYMGENLMSKQVCNGEAAKVISPMGEQNLEGEQLESMKVEAMIFPETQFSELGFTAELLGSEDVEGDDSYKMKITNPTGKTQIVYFSRSTGLKVKEVSETPQGNVVSLITEYTDVDGVKFPKAITQSVGPQSFDIVFDAITVNDDSIDAKYDI
ncbi:M16 family metallopeptidase [Carboxylicivirga linearis]|uniref:Insulinase family protein n=1 Tax=Carboxylicivirga linearis TaxID=1628157 RepID=A0ABS5JWU2_9BACT|nr:pitrilysin family protein [Carboxylicivirga linearis]MBS2098816.1 insulinase family protein [Carboxylicivirga linearis]